MSEGLHLENLEITQDGRALVRLDAHVAPGEVLTIMGPSGSGKSTLLSALVGDLAPAFRMSGRIWLNGRDITALPTAERRVGLLFQDDILFPHLSVAGNLGFALPAAIPQAERAARIAGALAEAGLEGFEARDPATLSGGQRTRVALMRTLLARPRALLLDEPFSRLDAERRARLRSFVLHCAEAHGLPVVLVTHDPEDARAAGGRVRDPLGNDLQV
ncbi:ATP-binding cassette domain-containing protein [Alkalilacustris brevis]|uniref:ATP-binding cassette domain-containing protein n=1 Tax=Alkalilacustris brevis TaxID=2026338 RepID=UPI000E0D2B9A|nr:ATP-binding cassette domain-containing protein [Alkalilacustris brevis]